MENDEVLNPGPDPLDVLVDTLPLPTWNVTDEPLPRLTEEWTIRPRFTNPLAIEPGEPEDEPGEPEDEQARRRLRAEMTDHDPMTTSNPRRRAQPVECPNCQGTHWKRDIEGAWYNTVYIDTARSRYLNWGEREDGEQHESEPWVCVSCDSLAGTEIEIEIDRVINVGRMI